jgi:pyruvate formate lyase activating enzyme
MTDIGIDLKGLTAQTFMKITATKNKGLAKRYLSTAWNAVSYLIQNYKDKVFTGIGIPYNEKLISRQEITRVAQKLCEIDPEIQVCALDYRPEFKRLDIQKPSFEEMAEVHKVLKSAGLKTVICQTERGHIGP